MTFTHDWFSHNIGNWTRWLQPLKGLPVRALEIGCYEGKATTWLLENVLTHPDSRIVVVDTFEGSEEHMEFGVGFADVWKNFDANVAPWAKKVEVFTGKSEAVVRHFCGPFQFAYIDGSHQAPDVLTDGCLVWPLMTKGAIVIFDDYGWDHYPEPVRNPRLGVDSFLNVFAGSYEMVAKEYQVCLRKL